MAEYEFECRRCKKIFALFMRISERVTTTIRCPRCGSEDVEALMQAFLAKTAKLIGLGNTPDRPQPSSFVECQDLTVRMAYRRFTRLCNGFKKKLENPQVALALHFA